MFANYLLLVLWIVTLVQGDDDQYCDDTGCYPIVCDSDGCYVDYVVTKTELATYTPVVTESVVITIDEVVTYTTCFNVIQMTKLL